MASSKTELKYLPNKMVLYVPMSKAQNSFIEEVSKVIGGVTSIEVDGAWVNAEGKLTWEPVFQYHMLYTTQQALALNELVQAEIQRLLASGEEAVLLETSGAHGVLYSKLGD